MSPLLTLVAVLMFQAGISRTVLLPAEWFAPPLSLVWWLPLGGAAMLFVLGARAFDLWVFLGLSQLRARKDASPGTLVLRGVLRHVRHPWYSATILLMCAWIDGTDVSLVMRLVLVAYTIVGTLLEERKLVSEFPDAYPRYQREVPMLLPRLRPVRDI